MDNDLYVAYNPSGSSYELGNYVFVNGFYGPARKGELVRLQAIEPKCKLIHCGSPRQLLLLLGIVDPENEKDATYLESRIEELKEALETFSQPQEDVFNYPTVAKEMRDEGFDYREWLSENGHEFRVHPNGHQLRVAYKHFQSLIPV